MNSESGEADKQSKAKDGANKVPPVPSNSSPVANVTTRDTENETANQPNWQRRHYWMQFAVFLVGAVVAFIYGCQLNEMRKSTNAATKAAKAAEDNVALARENARLDQRAWVSATILTNDNPPKANKALSGSVVIKNSGKTFARRVSLAWYIQPVWKENAPDFEGGAKIEQSSALLSPNAEYVAKGYSSVPLTQAESDNIKSGEMLIYTFGKITYTDIFDCPHWTTFCSYLKPGDWKQYEICLQNNDTDDNCLP